MQTIPAWKDGVGRGDTKFPVWPEEDAKWKANENRRVEVMFVKK